MKTTFKTLPLFKTHYSVGKSILTLNKPTGKEDSYPYSVFDMLIPNKIDTLVLVEDSVSGLLEASKMCKENKVNLVFGLRLSITMDMNAKSEENLKDKAKYIIFAKNYAGYENLIKIWSAAAGAGFYYEPVIDFKTLKTLWNPLNLKLTVPFYDSFIFMNTLESHRHVPDFSFTKPTFLIEENGMPFDALVAKKVGEYCDMNDMSRLKAQSIFYKKPSDFLAYVTFRCIHNRTTIQKPNLEHMSSDEFNFNKWLKENQ